MSIAITGTGIVSAIGLNKVEVLRSLQEKRTGIGRMRFLDSMHKELPVGEVRLSNEEMKERLGIKADKEISRTALMGMIALEQALQEAGVAEAAQKATAQKPLRIVLLSGTTVGGMDITERHYEEMTQGGQTDYLKQHDCGSCTSLMADHFGLFTEVTTISTACSSAANAMVLGGNMLKAGEADIVVAGGTEALSRFHLNGFNALMILDKDRCRPFDATRAGLNLGEGAAFIVMESETLAVQRGAKVQAYLSGYGNRCDAFHQTASSENGEGATQAMLEALTMAGISPNGIDYINAHGTGTPDNDRSESAALCRVFGDQLPPVSSTKGYTGHTTSASGGIEAVISLLAIQQGFIPANLGWANAMPDGIKPTLGMEHATLQHVLCNSFGFGGNDTALVFSAKAPVPATLSQTEENFKPITLSTVEITSDEDLAAIRQYVKPMEARRMGRLMKGALLSSLKALEEAGVDMPDAIITGTRFGCLENSERLLEQIRTAGEQTVSPTYFMQSTHNTISSAIAIKTHCHGYNMTYTQGTDSLTWALRDAQLLIKSGRYKTVLVGCHDESTPLFRDMWAKATGEELPALHCVAMVLTAETSSHNGQTDKD